MISPRFAIRRDKTYRAARIVGTRLRVETAVLIPARSAEVVALELDIEVELRVGGGGVLEDREPLAVVLADTKVDRGPVANGLAAVTPLAALLGRDTLGVDVVLSGSGLALPLEVPLAIRAGQGLDVSASAERNSLGFGTYTEIRHIDEFSEIRMPYQDSQYGKQQPPQTRCS